MGFQSHHRLPSTLSHAGQCFIYLGAGKTIALASAVGRTFKLRDRWVTRFSGRKLKGEWQGRAIWGIFPSFLNF